MCVDVVIDLVPHQRECVMVVGAPRHGEGSGTEGITTLKQTSAFTGRPSILPTVRPRVKGPRIERLARHTSGGAQRQKKDSRSA